MKLLITGGAGFIGSNFVHYWVRNYPNDEIVVLDKLTYAGNLENLAQVAEKIKFIKGDICNPTDVASAMEGCGVVVHFAAESHVDRSISGPDEFIKTNVFGTHELLKAALKNKVKRFHHISTDEVFGQIPLDSKEKWTEDSPYNPRSPYSASKAASDHLVRAYYATYGLPITISNCSNNFGPMMFPEKFIPLAVTSLAKGNKIPVYTPGNQVRDWLYVEDHCRAIDLILKKGKTGETYLVGASHKEYSNLVLAKMIVKLMGQDENMIELVKDRPGHDVKYAIDSSKIQKELGWKPMYDFEEELKTTVGWYKENAL
ncbi:MAG: dTDP-glucose 4,6-dehydratase [Candidatus Doudnabacteria bacterium CG10_big_fil_rev_8_21_14_0_10_42_18]|uniref:dTDP-glucose 4,6-dehydratase n=1 Tax=Candidatus Doudnabacteria bacterium CG10_big_fil_rev_8_21_14_0_10_42_18 TaxID=1974552 RepID=A0A2H0VE86_9BACT|nr:MAG: dTDP-glucose 4,6-dehydratase [Candidatus Doudnabacteria bacterium CG10_big_fil_rev_8_21_14_0_10_42_18]